jgi:hypothetical protein
MFFFRIRAKYNTKKVLIMVFKKNTFFKYKSFLYSLSIIFLLNSSAIYSQNIFQEECKISSKWGARVFETPSFSSDSLMSLSKGAIVQKKGSLKRGFLAITSKKYKITQGYIYHTSAHCKKLPSIKKISSVCKVVGKWGARVFSKNRFSASTLGRLNKNESVTRLDLQTYNSFYKVLFNNEVGYISQTSLLCEPEKSSPLSVAPYDFLFQEESRDVVAQRLTEVTGTPYEATSLVQKRAENIINELDKIARKQYTIPDYIPKPSLIIYSDSISPNFTTNPVPICPSIKVKGQLKSIMVVNKKVNPSSTPKSLEFFGALDVMFNEQGELEETRGAEGESCIKKELSTTQINHLLDFLTRQKTAANQKCDYKRNGAHVSFSSSCFQEDGKNLTEAEYNLVYLATSNILTGSADYIEYLGSNEELTSVIAHELGHYYMGHFHNIHARYNFLYEAKNAPHHPKANPSWKNATHYLLTSQERVDEYRIPFSEQQFFSSEIYTLLNSLRYSSLEPYCKNRACKRSCKSVEKARKQASADAIFDEHDSIFLDSKEKEKTFRMLEKKLLQCTHQITDSKSIHAIMSENRYFNAPIQSFYSQNIQPLSTFTKTLLALSSKINLDKQKMTNMYRQMKKGHVLLFTFEQHADQFALDMLHQVGIAPKEAINMRFNIEFKLKNKRQKNPALWIPYRPLNIQQCHALYNQPTPFEKNGSIMIMNFGGLNSLPYYDSCSRIWQMNQIIRKNNYIQKTNSRLKIKDTGTWNDVLKSIESDRPNESGYWDDY